MSYYRASRNNIRQHIRTHQQRSQNLTGTDRRIYCLTCYPRPPIIPVRFNNFWTWITHLHHARQYTEYTVVAFKAFDQNYNVPDSVLADLAEITTLLIRSVRFSNLTTLITELCFYFHSIYTETNRYSNAVTSQITTCIYNRFHNPTP